MQLAQTLFEGHIYSRRAP